MKLKHMGYLFLLFIFIISSSPFILWGEIPEAEREALIAIYNSCNGDMWIENPGWKDEPLEFDGFGPKGSEGEWNGVTVRNDHVTELVLKDVGVNGPLPEQMADLTYLESLVLQTYVEKVPLPAVLGSLPNLRKLEARRHFGGQIPPELGNLSKLTYLYLGESFTGYLPGELGRLTHLESLNIEGRFEGEIPPQWGDLVQLNALHISNNNYFITKRHSSKKKKGLTNAKKGIARTPSDDHQPRLPNPFPPEFGKLVNLEHIFISWNFSGPLPPEIGNLINLQGLVIHGAHLEGPIPMELGNLTQLKTLHLSSFSGEAQIPQSLGLITTLESLHLSYSNLQGQIPPELSYLTQLKNMYLNMNSLSGPIPQELGSMGHLKFVNLEGNLLSGEIPMNIANLNANEFKISYNCLFTSNDMLRRKLDIMDPDWEKTQTIAPTGVSVTQTSTGSVRVKWKPIVYSQDAGRYLLYFKDSPKKQWIMVGKTDDKTVNSFDITGLTKGTTYYFALRTQTDAHFKNVNTAISHLSQEAKIVIK